jgi:hypothetical protein
MSKPAKPIPDVDASAFWARVDQSAGKHGCWPWIGAKMAEGYGYLRLKGRSKFKAHRVALWLSTGEQAPQMMACHRCDNPPCCNPAHLFWGDNATNNRDMVAKGRNRTVPLCWPRNPHSKLTPEIVQEARALAGKVSQQKLAKRYGVTLATLQRAIHRQTWRHVP